MPDAGVGCLKIAGRRGRCKTLKEFEVDCLHIRLIVSRPLDGGNRRAVA